MLSKEQLDIVNTVDGPVLVVSCPGSGKTTVIINRTHHMIESGILPENILVITFTKEAATQMEERFKKEFGITGVNFGTIHSFCFKVLAKTYGYTKKDILTSYDQWEFFRDLFSKDVKKDDFEEFIKNVMAEISYVRNTEKDYRHYEPEKDITEKEFRYAFEKYAEFKKHAGKLDFDDMLIETQNCLKEKPEVLEHWQEQYKYIMVDEYQDTSSIQADICNMLAAKSHNICAVGDDDQSIYRFRGANVSIILDFPKKHPGCKVFNLNTNYRSGKTIVQVAGNLISFNQKRFKKGFVAHREETGDVKVVKCKSSSAQTIHVVKEIQEYYKKGIDYSDMAILYRTNRQNALIVGRLMKKEIPFYTTEPVKDYHQEFIYGDIMAYYRLSQGIGTKTDLKRILNRPKRYLKSEVFKDCSYIQEEMLSRCRKCGDKSGQYMEKIFRMFHDVSQLAKRRNPRDFIDYLCNFMNYEDSLESYADFCQKDLGELQELLKTLREEATQFETMDEWDAYAKMYAEMLEEQRKSKRKSGVCLSTFHSSKGLEWNTVFIIDAINGMAPYKKAETVEDYEEERRLFYVGMTRAKDNLLICHTEGDNGKDISSEYLKQMRYRRT